MSDAIAYIQFLAEARSGDQAGMGHLARLVWERLYPFVFRTTQDRDATEDILQETLLTMLCRLGSLRDGERFWPWIYRIAWSRIQDRVRDRRLRTLHETAVRRRAYADDHTSCDNDPLDVQVHEETLEQVAAAIAELNRQQRDVLALRCYEDLPYAEIAARTRISPERARVHFHRAKKSLKARLACCP